MSDNQQLPCLNGEAAGTGWSSAHRYECAVCGLELAAEESAALVLMEDGRITEAHTWTTKPRDTERWRDLQTRAKVQAERIHAHILLHPGGIR